MNKNEALGLPPGSIRAIIALSLVASVIASYIVSHAIPEGIMALASAAVGYYFGGSKVVASSGDGPGTL